MTLNLVQLTTLLELARRGTMVAVAEELGYTPGAVSQQIAALERAVHTPLIVKLGRNVRLTDAGTILCEHAKSLLAAERAARDAVLETQERVAGSVIVGVFGSTAAALLPAVVARAVTDYPQMRLRSCELDLDGALDAVAAGRVDVAFGLDYPSMPLPRIPGVELITLRQERFGLVVSPGAYGIRTPGRIDLRDAAEWEWILPPAHTQYGTAIRNVCRQYGFEPRASHEIIDTAVTLTLASKGLGAAPVTDMMLGLGSALPLLRLTLAQEVLRTLVLIRQTGADARPTVRATTAAVQDTIANGD